MKFSRLAAFLLNALLCVPALAQEIGLQLYSLRHQVAENPRAALAQVAEWGIDVVEGGGSLGELSPQEFRAALEEHGLAMVSVSASFEELRDEPMAVVQRARDFDARLAVFFWVPHDGSRGFTLADAQATIEVMNRAGKVLQEHGITLQYHPHGYEFAAHPDGTLLDHILRNVTEAEFQMDVFWIRQGGADPLDFLRRYPGRFKTLHLKDRLPGTPDSTDGHADEETNVVLGTGDVDIAATVAEARRQGARYFFIEDESTRVLAQVPQSIAYLRSLEVSWKQRQ